MRRHTVVIILLCLFVFWLVLVAYIAGSPGEQVGSPVQQAGSPQANAGLTGVTRSPVSVVFSLEETNMLLADLSLDKSNTTMEKTIYFIQAEDVDDDGNAPSWMYGVVGPLGASMLAYDETGWTIIPWKGKFPYTPVAFNSTIPLGTLMQDNKDLLATSTGQKRQVVLYNDTFQVTISDGAEVRTHNFDAITGILVEPYEE